MSKAEVSLGANTSNFRRGIDGAKRQLQGFQSLASGGFSFGQALGAAALLTTVKSMADEMDRFHKLSLRLGVSAEVLQRIGHSASKSGTELDRLVDILQQINLKAREANAGSSELQKAFKDLGVDAKSYASLGIEDQMYVLSDAVKEAGTQNLRLAKLQKLAGDSAAEAVPFLQQGAEALKEQAKEAAVLSDEAIEDIANVNDTFSDMFNTLKTFAVSVLTTALNLFKKFVASATQSVIEIIDIMEKVGGIIAATLSGNFDDVAKLSEKLANQVAGSFDRIADAAADIDRQAERAAKQRKREAEEAKARADERELQAAKEIEKAKELEKLLKDRKKAEEELAKAQEAARQEELSALEKLAEAQKELISLNEQLNKATADGLEADFVGDEVASQRAAVNAARLKKDILEQEKIIREESATIEQNQAEERRAAAQSNLDTLNEMIEQNTALRDSFQRNAAGFAGTIDNLTAVGIGVANTTTEQPNEQKALLEAQKSANRFLEQINDNVREQELVLEEDDF